MTEWVKISDNLFIITTFEVQFSIDESASIYLHFDIKRYPQYFDILIDLYENGKSLIIESPKFLGESCFIKTIDVEHNDKLSLGIKCLKINTDPKSVRRDRAIDDILGENKTFYVTPL